MLFSESFFSNYYYKLLSNEEVLLVIRNYCKRYIHRGENCMYNCLQGRIGSFTNSQLIYSIVLLAISSTSAQDQASDPFVSLKITLTRLEREPYYSRRFYHLLIPVDPKSTLTRGGSSYG